MPKNKTDTIMPKLRKVPDFDNYISKGEIPITFVVQNRTPEEKYLQQIPVFNRTVTDKLIKDILTINQLTALRQFSSSIKGKVIKKN